MSILIAHIMIGILTMAGLLLDDAAGGRKRLGVLDTAFLLSFAAAMGPLLTALWWRDYLMWCEREGLEP